MCIYTVDSPMKKILIPIAVVLLVGSGFVYDDDSLSFDIPLSFLFPNDPEQRLLGEIAYDPITNQMYVEVDGITKVYCGLPETVFNEFNTTIHQDSFYAQIIEKEFGC